MQQTDLITRVIVEGESFGDYLQYWRDVVMPKKRVNGSPLSSNTVREYKRIINTLITELGHHSETSITQRDIAEYLETRSSAEVYNKHRTLLVMIFKQMVSDGKVPVNIAANIIKRDAEKVKRQALSIEQYKVIYSYATPAIRNAMELSLNALQRRGEIQRWRFDSKHGDYYQVIIEKTKKHGKDSMLEIPATLPVAFSAAGAKTLDEVIRNCRDELACPFVIHEQPKRRRESKEKQHSMQLSLKQISDGFAEAREAAGIITEYPPTFHELLALGEALRMKQGWTLQQIQKLRGHRKEKTTQDYLDRQITWVRIEVPNGA
ncbi:MAG: tyrosine-type recombinase/integrase [Methylophaga sp.]|nr:tyrosine-type recombinase/integrase [Methylophaga sp.]